jgi:hypothetical protein
LKAIEYGLIDRIVKPNEGVAMEAKNYDAILAQSQAMQRGRSAAVTAGADSS